MDALWGWIVIYALGLTILQLLLYRYLVNGGGTVTDGSGFGDGGLGDEAGEADLDGDRGAEVRLDPFTARADAARWTDDGETRVCPRCGAENEPERAFSRCWNCAGQL